MHRHKVDESRLGEKYRLREQEFDGYGDTNSALYPFGTPSGRAAPGVPVADLSALQQVR